MSRFKGECVFRARERMGFEQGQIGADLIDFDRVIGYDLEISTPTGWIRINASSQPYKDLEEIQQSIQANGAWWIDRYSRMSGKIVSTMDENGEEVSRRLELGTRKLKGMLG